MDVVFDKVRKVVCDQFGVEMESVTEYTCFREDLDADLVEITEIMMALENEFGIEELDEDTVFNIETVGDAVDVIKSLR